MKAAVVVTRSASRHLSRNCRQPEGGDDETVITVEAAGRRPRS